MINTKCYLGLFLFIFFSNSLFGQNYIKSENDWAFEMLGLTNKTSQIIPKRNVKVAIIDDGFFLKDDDFKGLFFENSNEIPDNDIDDDNNGKIDDFIGWDISDNDKDIIPKITNSSLLNHGIKVIKLFLEAYQRSAGSLEKLKIIPLKASSDNINSNYIKDGYAAIQYAIDLKADIIVCCWSGGVFDEEKSKILSKCKEKGIILICSGGNFVLEKEQYPGAFAAAINVAAIDKKLKKETVSNCGNFIDLSIPGDSLKIIENSYFSGTSASAAILGGLVTSIFVGYEQVNAENVDIYLKNSCVPIEKYNPLFMGKLGAGILNFEKLTQLLSLKNTPLKFTSPKGYISSNVKNTMVTSLTQYPVFKVLNAKKQNSKNQKVSIRTWTKAIVKDTTFSLWDLNRPQFIKSDSFMVSFTKKDKNHFIYFEAQTIDSSTIYCKETIRITERSGTISDNSKDNNYANNSSCKWEIEVDVGKKIELVFDTLDIETGMDKIYIFSDFGTESPILAIFTGYKIPPKIVTWSNRAMIWFVTNSSVTKKGWKLDYKVVD
jgi:serine protease